MNPCLYKDVSQCKACALLGENHVPSEGNPYAELMIIGQSPGVNEVAKKKPFCGPSGELLDMMLEEAELDRSNVYIANALKCHPPGNRKANEPELVTCKSLWLSKEIKSVDPKVILLLGKDAFESVIPGKLLSKWGHLNTIKSNKRVYLSSYHPSYFLRRGDLEGFIVKVGRTVREVLDESISG